MPKTHSDHHDREHMGPCPPGYILKEVEGHWCCVSEDGEIVAPNTEIVGSPVVNPCPPGYTLAIDPSSGRMMCKNIDNGVIKTPEAARRSVRLRKKGGGGGPDPFHVIPAKVMPII